ncbi:hypothetical protein CROQUDRAFT_397013 [Cronartium quercuum f. sp. fusiforme G11]|uniref:Uncharacterized protein n=1 Tax=Cronartium quercuum f. sp. fusiforme G11 TaxID=708437 RepID=A0A9P6NQM7_9BASI|nr:hypothetical protein CROQUDRAFT_397013 [Cronartium quercuum f. sp. fusiforme G11]
MGSSYENLSITSSNSYRNPAPSSGPPKPVKHSSFTLISSLSSYPAPSFLPPLPSSSTLQPFFFLFSFSYSIILHPSLLSWGHNPFSVSFFSPHFFHYSCCLLHFYGILILI